MSQPQHDRAFRAAATSPSRLALSASLLGASFGACSHSPSVADFASPSRPGKPDAQLAPAPLHDDAGVPPQEQDRSPSQRRDGGSEPLPRPPAADASAPPPVTSIALDALTPRLVSEEYDGPLCPRGTLSVDPGMGGGPLKIRLAARLDADDAASTVRATCRVKLRLEIPGRYTFASAHLYANGHGGSSSGDANLSIRYGIVGASESQSIRRSYDGPAQPFQLYGSFDSVWSPSCQGDGRIEVVLDIDASASGDARLSLHELELGFSHVDGAVWKRCDGALVRPRPSGKGLACAGLARQPCESGLACALRDAPHVSEPLLTGVCIDPMERSALRAAGEPCNVGRGLACRADLVCHYAGSLRVDGLLGVCTARSGRRGDRCGGSPALSCEAGMLCSVEAGSTCQPGDGSLGSPCQEGAVACANGLECRDAKCAHPLAGEGERCAGAEAIACRAPLACDATTKLCAPLARPPKEGERCSGDGPACEAGLICMHLRCQPEDTPYRGKPCADHDECGAKMRCTDSMVCWDERNGMEKATCDADYPCNAGLTCSAEGLCVRTTSAPGELTPEESDPALDETFESDGISITVTRS